MGCAYAGRVADAVVAEIVVVAEVLRWRLGFRVSGRVLWERDGDGYVVVVAAASGDLLHKIGRTATASGCYCCCSRRRRRRQWWCGGYYLVLLLLVCGEDWNTFIEGGGGVCDRPSSRGGKLSSGIEKPPAPW